MTVTNVLSGITAAEIQSAAGLTNVVKRGIYVTATNGGATLTTGVIGFIQMAYAGTINSVTLMGDASGSVVVDIWKVAYASFPPTNSNSICASDLPTLSSAQNSTDSTLTGWTTTFAVGDVLAFNINSVATLKSLNIDLAVTLN